MTAALPPRIVNTVRRLALAPEPVCAYLYDQAVLAERAAALRAALPPYSDMFYAVKANAAPAVLATLTGLVDGFEVASLGEIGKVRRGDCAARIVFSGPGKTDQDLAGAVEAGLFLLNVESVTELRRVALVAATAGVVVPITLRVNLRRAALAGSHRMAGEPTQFGIDEESIPEALDVAQRITGVELRGFHFHAVSNNTDAAAHAGFVEGCLNWSATMAHRHHVDLRTVDVGGGLGIDYAGGPAFDLSIFGECLAALHPPAGVRVLFEPGRFLVAPAGWYAAEIIDLKRTHGRWFAVLRGGTHHFRLPAAWRHSHPFGIVPLDRWAYPFDRPEIRNVPVTLAGELCTPRDVLAFDALVDRLRIGDIAVFPLAGAYGWEISHHEFLSHRHPAHVVLAPADDQSPDCIT